ncbi:MAG: serine hydrolase domain-containing protein [Cytophagaceae bacterium]
MKKQLLIVLMLSTSIFSCRKKEVGPTHACTPAFADSSTTHPKKQRFQTILDKYTRLGLPGISVLMKDSSGTWAGASGKADIDKQINMEVCHVSKVASITKIFMGTLTMKLVEEGTFGLDDKISNWLDAATLKKVKNADQCSIRDLMGHTSGIYDVITDNGFYLAVLNNPAKKWKPEELLKFVEDKDPAFAFGTKASYSNTNFLLLSMVIDKASGRSHADLLKEKIIQPLGLNNTYYYYHDALPDVAQGYFDLYNNGTIVNLSNYNTGSGNGYTGLYTCVYDMHRFLQALYVQKTILQQSSLDQMLTFNPTVEFDRQLGLATQKDLFSYVSNEYGYGHRGRDLAYSADLFYFPIQDKSMAVIVNYGTDGNSALRQTFYDFRLELVDALLH